MAEGLSRQTASAPGMERCVPEIVSLHIRFSPFASRDWPSRSAITTCVLPVWRGKTEVVYFLFILYRI